MSLKKFLPLLLACMLALSATGMAFAQESSLEPITLTIWNSEILTPGIQSDEVAQAVLAATGVTMNIVQGDADKFSVLTAGGDLPDIIYSNPAQQNVTASTLIEGGSLIALDDLLNQYGQDILANFGSRVEYSKQFISTDGKCYLVPILCYQGAPGKAATAFYIANCGLMTRFDVYKAIGAPEIKTTDDYLNVLLQMQEYARANDLAGGLDIYAISGWCDWGIWPWYLSNMREQGLLGMEDGSFYDYRSDSIVAMYESEDFWDSLYFYNKAYNMGILDPEAFTMSNDQFWEKANNGQVLMAYASWQTEYINDTFDATGHGDWSFQKLPFDGYNYVWGVAAMDAPLGNRADYALGITKNCKNPERAMQFINFFSTEEGARLVYSGVENLHWEYDETGKPTYTEYYKNLMETDANYRSVTGTTLYNKLCSFSPYQVLADGYPANISNSDDLKAVTASPADKAYCDFYGEKYGQEFLYPGMALSYLWQQDQIKTVTNYVLWPSLAQAADSETTSTLSLCDAYMSVQAVQMIMASSLDQFNAFKAEAISTLKDKGYETVVAAINARYEAAREAAGSFKLN